MFTIKFCKVFDDGKSTETNISAPHYEVYTRSSENHSITVYKSFSAIDGVEYKVTTGECDFDVCYIENEIGKTINTVRAIDR